MYETIGEPRVNEILSHMSTPPTQWVWGCGTALRSDCRRCALHEKHSFDYFCYCVISETGRANTLFGSLNLSIQAIGRAYDTHIDRGTFVPTFFSCDVYPSRPLLCPTTYNNVADRNADFLNYSSSRTTRNFLSKLFLWPVPKSKQNHLSRRMPHKRIIALGGNKLAMFHFETRETGRAQLSYRNEIKKKFTLTASAPLSSAPLTY